MSNFLMNFVFKVLKECLSSNLQNFKYYKAMVPNLFVLFA